MSPSPVSQQAASPAPARDDGPGAAPVSLARILVAVDASDHANRALAEAVRLASSAGGTITGIHAYAARLHDRRFRQMEGGLPERYRGENALEHQREVHDDLITRGLNVISDSYHDAAAGVCEKAGVPYRHLSPEGKNYRQITEATASGGFDLLVLGALGLGAVPGGVIGTVCERVVRRSPIDVLVVRDPARSLADGPLVVGVDGSAQAYGALKTALDIARRLEVPVHAVASYDPYFHYVAFNRIADVLSEEAGRVFRFREQEKLHEELIDDGLAKIYRSHLEIARAIAEEEGSTLTCELLDGKPFQAIGRYVQRVGASLLLLGKTGIHADPELDIGGNAENLLRMAPCHVWLGQVTYTPPMEAIARETISWTAEAEKRMARVPETARDMVRMAVVRYAQERGHTVVTESVIEEATKLFCPARGAAKDGTRSLTWSDEATALLARVGDSSLAAGIRLRAEKHARRAGAQTVSADHVRPFLDEEAPPPLAWTAGALARLARVPEDVRAMARAHIEEHAREIGAREITLELAEAGLARVGEAGGNAMKPGVRPGSVKNRPLSSREERRGGCPFPELHGGEKRGKEKGPAPIEWMPEAEARLESIPRGFMRVLTRQRIEAFARSRNARIITPSTVDDKYAEWAAGSAQRTMNLEWSEPALKRINRVPDLIRGMVILEVERCAREMGKDSVTDEVMDRARSIWEQSGTFHSEKNPDFYK